MAFYALKHAKYSTGDPNEFNSLLSAAQYSDILIATNLSRFV
jgi:hypothetical protein